jgi:hypothetical protein
MYTNPQCPMNTKQYRSTYVTVGIIRYRATTRPTGNPDTSKQLMSIKMIGTRYPDSTTIINTSDCLATAAKAEINSWLKKTI